MTNRILKKIKSNLRIYKEDLKKKGLYYSIIHRLYKIPGLKKKLVPLVNYLKPAYITFGNYKLYIDKSDSIVSENLLFSKEWEKFETRIFKQNIKPGDTILDIGAHIGYYTLIASKLVGERGKVYSFEPAPQTFKLLQKNIRENNIKNVILINKAVTGKSSNIKLYLNNENTGDHRIYNSEEHRKSVSIKSISLDDFFKGKDQKINLIKMDIQGAEFEALMGGLQLIKKNPNIKIFTEFWPMGLELNHSNPENFLDLLTKQSYKLFQINEKTKKLEKVTVAQLLMPYPLDRADYTNLYCSKN